MEYKTRSSYKEKPGRDYSKAKDAFGRFQIINVDGEFEPWVEGRDSENMKADAISLTVPGLDMTIEEMIARYTRGGRDVSEIYKPQYLESEHLAQVSRMSKMDLLDLAETIDRAVDTYDKRQKFEKEERERREAVTAGQVHTNEKPLTPPPGS